MDTRLTPPVFSEWLELLSRDRDVMRCLKSSYDITEVTLTYIVTSFLWLLAQAMEMTSMHQISLDDSTMDPNSYTLSTTSSPEKEFCCSGVLGYASDNVSLNFPCQGRPCCNKSEAVAVVAVDFAMGFRFQCMPRTSVQPLCYQKGVEVRTSNQDPDFIPRVCCEGLKFKVVLNQWYAAMVVKCVLEKENEEKDS